MNPTPAATEPPNCQICEASSRCLFSGLPLEQQRILRRERVFRHFKRGQIIFYQGDVLTHVFCVEAGALKVYKTDAYSREIVIRLLGAGDIVGYRPLLASEPAAATAETLEAATLCMIPKAAFLSLAEHSNELRGALLRQLARDLRDSEDQWFRLSNESLENRVSAVLSRLSEQAPQTQRTQSGVRITVPRTEIARAVGITPSTLSRVLRRLVDGGTLTLESRKLILHKIHIINPLK